MQACRALAQLWIAPQKVHRTFDLAWYNFQSLRYTFLDLLSHTHYYQLKIIYVSFLNLRNYFVSLGLPSNFIIPIAQSNPYLLIN